MRSRDLLYWSNMKTLLAALVVLAVARSAYAQRSRSTAQPVPGDAAIAPETLSDAATYMPPIIHNYVAENSVKGWWTIKEKNQAWRLKMQDVADDSTVKLGNRRFAMAANFRSDRKPIHHLEIDFIVDFNETPWLVKSFIVHKIDGKEVNPEPRPPSDLDELAPSTSGQATTNGPAPAASSTK